MFRPHRFFAFAFAAASLFTLTSGVAHAQASEYPDFSPSEPPVVRPHHQGFTLELGLGAAMTNLTPTSGQSQSQFGLAPLSLSLGGFVTKDVAFLVRAAGSSYFEKNKLTGGTDQYVNGFYGAHVQYWFNDELMISAGPGVAVFGRNRFLSGPATEAVVGYGASVRIGYAFATMKHHAFRIAYEAFPSKYDDKFVFGSAINLEWQYF